VRISFSLPSVSFLIEIRGLDEALSPGSAQDGQAAYSEVFRATRSYGERLYYGDVGYRYTGWRARQGTLHGHRGAWPTHTGESFLGQKVDTLYSIETNRWGGQFLRGLDLSTAAAARPRQLRHMQRERRPFA
jgi:hypothetical protein